MMRKALGCTKMKRLCRNLDIRTYQAVGILESLWHLTANETPQGDIGKLSNEDIALAIDWIGDEDKLIQSLVVSGWLDSSTIHRLIVHDWHQHADDAVDNRLARAVKLYASGVRPRMNRLSVQEKATLCAQFDELAILCAQNPDPCALPEPVASSQLPEPEPEPGKSTDIEDLGQIFSPRPAVEAIPEKQKSQTAMQRDFQECWSAIWLKTGAAAAFKAYDKQRKAGVTHEVLLTAIKAQGAGILENARRSGITPIHPATWFNQARYLDEEAAYRPRDGPNKPGSDRIAMASAKFAERMAEVLEEKCRNAR